MEQRAGRIIRQGNTNEDVHIYRYVTEQTFDAYLYQLVENKQKFISQIMTSKTPVRSAEDVDSASLSFAEIKALASGNPKVKEKMDLDNLVSKLKLSKANFLSQKYELEDKIIKYYPQKIKATEQRLQSLISDRDSVKPANEFTSMKIKDIVYDKKEMAGNALLLACKQVKGSEPIHLGTYRDFEMSLQYDSFHNVHSVLLKRQLTYPVDLGNDVYGNIIRLDNAIESIGKKVEVEMSLLEETKQQFENAKEEVQKPFNKETELQEATKKLSKLNKELDIGDKKEKDLMIDTEEKKEPNRTISSQER